MIFGHGFDSRRLHHNTQVRTLLVQKRVLPDNRKRGEVKPFRVFFILHLEYCQGKRQRYLRPTPIPKGHRKYHQRT